MDDRREPDSDRGGGDNIWIMNVDGSDKRQLTKEDFRLLYQPSWSPDGRFISAKKGEPGWLLDWRLKAYRGWLKMTEPHWPNVHYAPIDYQAASYFSAPKPSKKSLDEVDPEILDTYKKLGIPLSEQKLQSLRSNAHATPAWRG